MFLRRLLLAFSIFVSGSLALAIAGVASGGGLGTGNYSFTSRSADAFFGMGGKGGSGGPSWTVSVNQGLNSFKPTHPGGPRTVTNSTIVYVTEFDSSGNGGFGCFNIPAGDFVVSRDLASASLHATLTSDEVCLGYVGPVNGGADGVFAGGEGGLSLPLTVDVSWTATGATNTYKNSFTFRCLNYNQDGSSTSQYVNAGASGAISALGGAFQSESADLSSGSSQLSVHGTPPDACYA